MSAPAHSLRKNLAAVALLAAPVLLIAADTMHSVESLALVRYTLAKTAFALFIGVALACMHLLRGRADRAGTIGGILMIIGAMTGATLFTFGLLNTDLAAALDPT